MLGHKFPPVIIIVIHYSLDVDSVLTQAIEKDMILPWGWKATSPTYQRDVKSFGNQKRVVIGSSVPGG
jgi:hypothetical protein